MKCASYFVDANVEKSRDTHVCGVVDAALGGFIVKWTVVENVW